MKSIFKPTANLPGLLSDWLSTDPLLGKDLLSLDLLPSRRGVNIPAVNVSETPKEFILELAAPGLERNDFEVEVENHTLSISVEKEKEKEETNGYVKKEYSYQSFCRSFSLPENVKEDAIDAKYDKGILKVVVPKVKQTAEQPPKKVTVS